MPTTPVDLSANSWSRPKEDRNLPGELATDALNSAAAGDSGAPVQKDALSMLLAELDHSQALTRKLLKQLASK